VRIVAGRAATFRHWKAFIVLATRQLGPLYIEIELGRTLRRLEVPSEVLDTRRR
jgi:hypothetical protein